MIISECSVTSEGPRIDGSFWHGADQRARKFEFVQKRMLIDSEQNDWFSANGIKLVRLTEKSLDDAFRSMTTHQVIIESLGK